MDYPCKEAVWVPGTMEENSAVGFMPSPLLSLVESITPILNRGPRTMLVWVDQVRRWERVSRTALNIMV